jgi:hypothetical protein
MYDVIAEIVRIFVQNREKIKKHYKKRGVIRKKYKKIKKYIENIGGD